jgi:hypothetical protein
VRKIAFLILGLAGLAAVRMLARIARRRGDIPDAVPGAAELMWLLIYVLTSPAITKNTPKTDATKVRVDNLVTAAGATNAKVATATSQAGTVNTGNTAQVGATQTGESLANGGSTLAANQTPGVTGTTSSAGSPAHTHDYGGHWHGVPDSATSSHTHYENLQGTISSLISQSNAMYNALKAANLI